MANNRDASKQKRARQNRAQREALKARTTAATTPASERRPSTPSRTAPAGSAKKGAAEAKPKAKGGFFAPREGAVRAPRPGDLPVDVHTVEGNWLTKRNKVPGGRQVLYAFILTTVLGVLSLFTPVKDPDNEAAPAVSPWDDIGWRAVVVLGIPVILTFVAAHMILSDARRRVWIGVSFLLGFAVLFVGTAYLFPLAFLVFGIWRANKVEGPQAGRTKESTAGEPSDDGEPGSPDDGEASAS